MIVLGNALNLLNVDSYWQRVAVGAVIIAAAAAERLRSRSLKTGGSSHAQAPLVAFSALAGLAASVAAGAPPGRSAQEKTTIGVSLAQDDNPFYIAMLRGIRARAQELGWDVATVSANEDKLKQINGVQDLVARGVKGILISPIDAVGVNAAYDAAAAAKDPDCVGCPRLDLAEPDHPCGHGREADRPRHRGMDREEARRKRQGRAADGTERRAHVQESR